MKTLSRRRIIIYLSLFFLAVVCFFFWRDLQLGLTIDLNIPDVVVENIEIRRVVDGNEWYLRSVKAEHRQGVIYGQSIDITVTSANGGVSRILAENGVFSRENSDITVEALNADIQQDDRRILMKAGSAVYDSTSERWHFSGDVTISDGSIEVSGPEGFYDIKQGLSTITNGGTIKWLES